MSNFIGVSCLVGIALVSGCSSETAKRTAYETMQNVRQQECRKNLSSDCDKKDSYEDYERERKALEPSK
jgi:hypothetical protein